MKFVLANSLTIARLFLGLIFPLLPAGWRLPLVIVGALSDLFDGALSRRFHATSQFGKVLDPIADKIFVLGVVAALILDSHMTLWQVALIGLRDIAVLLVGGIVVLWRGYKSLAEMSPTLLGKLTTAFQFVLLVTVLYSEQTSIWLLAATTVVSGIAAVDYVRVLLKSSHRNPTV